MRNFSGARARKVWICRLLILLLVGSDHVTGFCLLIGAEPYQLSGGQNR